MIMLNSCALNRPWDVNEVLGVWRKRRRVQRKIRSRCRLGRAGVCGSNVQLQEAKPVVSSIQERVETVG